MTGNTSIVGTVHHVSFRVDDLDEALPFYVNALGCEVLPRPELSMRGAWLRAGSTEVHLIEASASDDLGWAPRALTNIACHVAFHVADLDAAEQALRLRGYEVFRGPELPQVMVQDPSGNIIELTPNGGY